MKRDSDTGISFFQRYLTVWVIICMVLGILIGKYLPSVPAFLNQFEYAKVSIPMAILIWLMIYPMMMKVDFQSIKNPEIAKDLFDPILFKGYLIGMTICYDCNHALFSRMYGIYGIDLIINSTGGNVVYDKWFKYNKVRAIEWE